MRSGPCASCPITRSASKFPISPPPSTQCATTGSCANARVDQKATMRWVFWILGLFALAVALALALRYNDGYALFVWPPYRIELSINLFALLLGASFVAGYLLVRFIFGALALPSRVRAYRERRRRDTARA